MGYEWVMLALNTVVVCFLYNGDVQIPHKKSNVVKPHDLGGHHQPHCNCSRRIFNVAAAVRHVMPLMCWNLISLVSRLLNQIPPWKANAVFNETTTQIPHKTVTSRCALDAILTTRHSFVNVTIHWEMGLIAVNNFSIKIWVSGWKPF